MSTAAATADAGAPKKGSKKLIIVIAASVLVLLLGGGAAAMLLSKKSAAHDQDAEAAEEGDAPAAVRHEPGAPPTFVPLDPFTVNLADREAERYAQVGITLEVADTKVGDQIKLYMPAVRNNILMALADKTAAQLMDRNGKKQLAEQVMRETSRALGYEVDEPDPEADEEEEPPRSKKKRRKKPEQTLPVTAVHFSNFIIQ